MAKTEDIKPEEKKEEMVMIRLPLTREHKEDVFVGVNGRTWLIKRGENVMVPECVREVLETSERMQLKALEYEDAVKQGLTNMENGVWKD